MPAEFEVFRLINHAHTPPTEPTRYAVVRDGLADHSGMPSLRVASSYERGIRESTNDSPDRSMSNPEHLLYDVVRRWRRAKLLPNCRLLLPWDYFSVARHSGRSSRSESSQI